MAVYIPGVTNTFADLATISQEENDSGGVVEGLVVSWNGSVATLRAPNTLSIIGIKAPSEITINVKSRRWDPAPTVDLLTHYKDYSSESYDARHVYVRNSNDTWDKNLMLLLDDEESNQIEVDIDFGTITPQTLQAISFSPVVVKNQLYSLSLFDYKNLLVSPANDCMISFNKWLGPSPLEQLGFFSAEDINRNGELDPTLLLNYNANLGAVSILFKTAQHVRHLKGAADPSSYLRLEVATKTYERVAALDFSQEKVLLGMQRPILCKIISTDCPTGVVFTRRVLHAQHKLTVAITGRTGEHLNVYEIAQEVKWSYMDKNSSWVSMGSTGVMRNESYYEFGLVVPSHVDYPSLKVQIDELFFEGKRYSGLQTAEMSKATKVKNLMDELMIADSSGASENILSLYNLSNSLAVAKSFTSL